MEFEIVKTNIINVPADAIVLPANENLKEGSGASQAIFEAAGRKNLTKACSKIKHCNTGSAVPTLAYQLNAKYIIHAVVPRWVDGQNNEYDLLSSAYLSALTVADIMDCESIAFPLLASGNNGFDLELAFRIAKENIELFSGTHLKKVILVIYGNHTEAFLKSLGYTVAVIPEHFLKDERKEAHRAKMEQLLAEGKDIAQTMLEQQIEKALEWLKDEEHQKKMMQFAFNIARIVIARFK